ncbi:MAG: DUF3828 domain-containing protein [Rhizobiales bacterium]|nr:DUF3828 domain-containing protein [Hyphomicrobiales bacterium]
MALSRRHVLFIGAALLSAVPLAAAASSPLAFLKSIYEQYGSGKDGVPLDDNAALKRWFTPSLAALIQHDRAMADEADDLPTLDGDPFVDAQDWDIIDLSVKAEDLGGGKAAGHVSFRNLGEAKTIELDLVETSAGWRVDDIHWGDASLRGLYTH